MISAKFRELIKGCWRIFRLENQLVNCIFRLQNDIIGPSLRLQKATAWEVKILGSFRKSWTNWKVFSCRLGGHYVWASILNLLGNVYKNLIFQWKIFSFSRSLGLDDRDMTGEVTLFSAAYPSPKRQIYRANVFFSANLNRFGILIAKILIP